MRENGKYRLLQSGYWMLFCIGYGYSTFFLKSYGYEAGAIGVITALFGILSAVMQTRLGRLADRSERWNWRAILLVLLGFTFVILLSLCFSRHKILVGAVMGLFILTLNCMMPMVNSACFYYQNRGKNINFGVARGIGSLSFAIVSTILGKLTANIGPDPVVILGLAVTVYMFIDVLSMPLYPDIKPAETVPAVEKHSASGKNSNFIQRYPAFILMVIGLVLLVSFHNMSSTYMLQIVEHLGGDSSSMGMTLSISAMAELPIMFGFAFLIKRFRSSSLLLFCSYAFIVKAALYYLAPNMGVFYAAQITQTFSFAIYVSASVFYTEKSMLPEDKVTGQALMSGVITLGAVVGNLIGGWVYDLLGVEWMLIVGILMTVAGALVVTVATLKKRV